MTTIVNFSNELHIRLFIAELLRDNIKDDDFMEQAEKMFSFIIKNASLPPQPKVSMSDQDFFSNLYQMMSKLHLGTNKTGEEVSEIERKYQDYKRKSVSDPKTNGRKGIIVGFSTDFNSLIALCDDNCPKGLKKGENDFVDWPESKTGNGFFYISVEEVKRQLDS